MTPFSGPEKGLRLSVPLTGPSVPVTGPSVPAGPGGLFGLSSLKSRDASLRCDVLLQPMPLTTHTPLIKGVEGHPLN